MADGEVTAKVTVDTAQATAALGDLEKMAQRTKPNAVVLGAVQALTTLAQNASEAGEHGAAGDLGGQVVGALAQLSEKSGVKTTEFYLAIVCKIIGGYLIVSGDDTRAALGAGLVAISSLGYSLSRGIAKKAAPVGLLFLALLVGGCAPQGYVKVDDIEPLAERVFTRHDLYVATMKDPGGDALTVDEVGEYLDTTKILRAIFAQAKKAPDEKTTK